MKTDTKHLIVIFVVVIFIYYLWKHKQIKTVVVPVSTTTKIKNNVTTPLYASDGAISSIISSSVLKPDPYVTPSVSAIKNATTDLNNLDPNLIDTTPVKTLPKKKKRKHHRHGKFYIRKRKK
jgi:hypothetical protein